MNIGLDYDDTITRDESTWATVVAVLDSCGHDVYIVTWRTPEEAKSMKLSHTMRKYLTGIYATSRQAKQKFMFEQGICIDVWIDDNPSAILRTMEGWEQ